MKILSVLICFSFVAPLYASEVIQETQTRVIVREHPKTGKPYVSIIPSTIPEPKDPFESQRGLIHRSDYRMLDPNIKAKDIPYQGPVSDRKKVYILAASLATVGAVGGTAIIAAAPAATGVGASGGAGAFGAAGSAVGAGAISAAFHKPRPDPEKDDFTMTSESKKIEESFSR